MKRAKSLQMIQIAFAGVVLAGFCGCKEDPGDKAAKQFGQQAAKTFDQFAKDRNPEAASQQLEQALSRNRVGGLLESSTQLSAADMQLARAQQDRAGLLIQTPTLNKAVEGINLILERLSDSSSQAQRVQNLLALSDTEITYMEKWIGSEPNTVSLKGQLAQTRMEEKQLLENKTTLQKEYQEARDAMLAIEAQAQEKLRQAEVAVGDKKAELEKAGFDMLSQKKDFYIKTQQSENAIAEADSEIAIVQPRLKRLEDSLKQAEDKLQNLKTAESRKNLQTQQQELTAEIQQEKLDVEKQLDQFKNQLAEYHKRSDEILASVNEVVEKHKKINSRLLEPNISMSLGQAYTLAGAVTAAKVYTASDLGLRLEGIFRTYETILPQGVSSLVSSKPQDDMARKAMEYFDLAAQMYKQAASSSSQLRNGAKEAACAALKGQMLAVNNKLRMADRLGDFVTTEKTQTQLNTLTEKAKDYGTLFSQSATAMLLTRGLDYIPTLPVDTSMILEGIKRDFASWSKLRGAAAETEVERLLTQIQKLRKDYPGDEPITQFLDQEQQAMEQAKTKGFAEETQTPADANSPSDANSLNQGF